MNCEMFSKDINEFKSRLILYQKLIEKHLKDNPNCVCNKMKEEHYLIMQGWENVQNFLGSRINIDEAKRMGVIIVKRGKGRGNKSLFHLSFELLEKILIKNRAKLKRLNHSVELLETWYDNYIDKKQEE